MNLDASFQRQRGTGRPGQPPNVCCSGCRGLLTLKTPPLRDWAFTTHHIPSLELYIEPWNIPSIRAAEAAGFQREGLLRWETVGGERRDKLMFSVLEEDIIAERA